MFRVQGEIRQIDLTISLYEIIELRPCLLCKFIEQVRIYHISTINIGRIFTSNISNFYSQKKQRDNWSISESFGESQQPK